MGRHGAGVLLLLLLSGAAPAEEFGRVELIEGAVTVKAPDGRTVTPKVGDPIDAGAEIVTGGNGALHLETADSGFLAVRPNTQLRIDDYAADGEDADRMVLSLLRGTFRSVTGWIGKHKPDQYRVVTPLATIGVRGTDHEPTYIPEGDTTIDPGTEPGVYDRVHEGASFIQTKDGRADVWANEAGHARKHLKPRKLKRHPRIFQRKHRHEQRVPERRESLKKVSEKRRAERRTKRQEERRKKKLKEQREQRREERQERRD